MNQPKYTRTTPEQFIALIEFMESHRDISMPQSGVQGNKNNNKLWQQLTADLNKINLGVKRTTNQWKRVWTDWKNKTKVKAKNIKKLKCSGTGGGPNCGKTISDLERRVLNVMGQAPLHNSNSEESILPSPSPPLSTTPPSSPSALLRITSPPENLTLHSSSHHRRFRPTPVQSSSQSMAHSLRQLRTSIRGVQRYRRIDPFERVSSAWVDLEHRRLAMEEARDMRTYKLEKERLSLESRRITLAFEQNKVLQQFATIAQGYLDNLRQQSQPTSTDETVSSDQ